MSGDDENETYTNLRNQSLQNSPEKTLKAQSNSDIKVEYIASCKGTPQLVIDGFPFTRHRVRDKTVYWRCVQFRILKCHARMRTKLEDEVSNKNYDTIKQQIEIVQNDHNHGILNERRKRGTLKSPGRKNR